MAVFEIQTPDGKTFEIEAPDQASAVKALEGYLAKPATQEVAPEAVPPAPQQEQPSAFSAALSRYFDPKENAERAVSGLRVFADSASFGGADYLQGTLGGTGVDAERAMTQKARDDLGVEASLLMDLAGGGAVGGTLLKAGAKLAKAIPGVTSAASRVGRVGTSLAGASAGGAGLSALYAAGHGEDPTTAAALGALLGPASVGAGAAVSSMLSKGLNAAPAVMSRIQLRNAATVAYEKARNAGVVFTKDAVDDFRTNLLTTLKDAGYNKRIHPKIRGVLDEAADLAKRPTPSLTELEQFRRIAGAAAKSNEADERRVAQVIIDSVDDFLDTLTPQQIAAGNAPEAVAALQSARELWRRNAKSQTIEEAFERATIGAAATGSGGNVNNRIRQELANILKNPKRARGFTEEERAIMKEVVEGTRAANAMRLIGKLSPEGNGLMMALGLGATAANPAMVAAPVVGAVAKRGADASTMSRAGLLDRTIRAGSRAAATRQGLSTAEQDAVNRALLSGLVPVTGGLLSVD